jgi:hypothetical protein
MCTPHYRVHRNRIVSLPDARRVRQGSVTREKHSIVRQKKTIREDSGERGRGRAAVELCP